MSIALQNILHNAVLQFAAIFGIFIMAAISLSLLSRWTNNSFRQFIFPNFGIYAFGFIGIPVHEFCHAFFCRVFSHEIRQVKWFDPKAHDGSHGAVTHFYSPWNIYHRIGHFFIGLGPVILAPVFLAALFYLLIPQGRSLFSFDTFVSPNPLTLAGHFVHSLFSQQIFTSVGFYIFIYLAACISSQLELSTEDLKQARLGLIPIVLILVLINVVFWSFDLNWHTAVLDFGLSILTLFSCLYVFSILLSAGTLLICTLFFSLINRICGRSGINPFRS